MRFHLVFSVCGFKRYELRALYLYSCQRDRNLNSTFISLLLFLVGRLSNFTMLLTGMNSAALTCPIVLPECFGVTLKRNYMGCPMGRSVDIP